MTGYSEVLQIIVAMIIFAMILIASNHYMLGNVERKVNSEVEVHAVMLAQNFIENSKRTLFDEATDGATVPNNIPGDFVESNPVPETSLTNREHIQFFEQFNGFSETIDTDLGEFTISSKVEYMGPSHANVHQTTPTKSIYKRITVTVSNPSLLKDVVLNYTRVYNNSN